MTQVEQRTSRTQVEDWLAKFAAALATADGPGAAELFVEDSFWRDLVAFTWNLKTVEGRAQIADLVAATAGRVEASNWTLTEEPTSADGVTEAWISFETAAGRGSGHLRLRTAGSAADADTAAGPQAWTLLTALDELKGFEEPRGSRRPKGAEHGANRGRVTWMERRQQEFETLGYTEQPYVLIVGGGQAGIALGARLRQLDVPTIIVDKHPRPGDQWRGRYKSLCLHDPVWYDHLPYIKFPDNWPVFSPKDKIGDWLESYTKVMELNFWGSTECVSASFDEQAQKWTIEVDRDGERLTLQPTQLVLATGVSGKKYVPTFPGMNVFRGEQHHSSEHPGPDAYKHERVVVIGSNNSAHDICAALWEVGADVTMVQRSSTHIVRSDSLMRIALGPLYSEEAVAAGMTTEKADMTFASIPYRIMADIQRPAYDEIRTVDADFYERLEKAGFLLDFGEDDSGLFMKYLRRGSGYYIDVGASELVASGEIKLEVGDVERLTEDSIVLTSGVELPADVIVYATGYGSMNGWAADLINQDVADRVGKVWGLGSGTTKDPGPWEGEERNVWKPTQQDNLWFMGGNLHQSRHYSTYLALQLKARREGLDTPVYGLQEVHHKA